MGRRSTRFLKGRYDHLRFGLFEIYDHRSAHNLFFKNNQPNSHAAHDGNERYFNCKQYLLPPEISLRAPFISFIFVHFRTAPRRITICFRNGGITNPLIQVTTEKDSSAYPWKPICRILDGTADPSCNVPGIREAVKELVGVRMDALARNFTRHTT